MKKKTNGKQTSQPMKVFQLFTKEEPSYTARYKRTLVAIAFVFFVLLSIRTNQLFLKEMLLGGTVFLLVYVLEWMGYKSSNDQS